MAKYIIKHNIPSCPLDAKVEWKTKKAAKDDFMEIADIASAHYPTKVIFRNNPLRGTFQIEVDGFYYYVELYKED